MSGLDFLYNLQQVRTPLLNTIMNLVSQLAGEVLLICALCILYWCVDKRLSYKLCFSYFVSGLAIQGLKVAFCVPRPWVLDSRLQVEAGAASGATGYSFPSGHTQAATSLYGTLAFHFKKWWAFLAGFFLIGLIMFSRMYLGCHTPKDVLVSFGVSLVLVLLSSLVFEKVKFTDSKRLVILILMEIISVGLAIFTYYQIASGKITGSDINDNAMDCFKSCGAGMGFGLGYYLESTRLKFNPRQGKKIWIHILKVVIGAGLALALKELPKIIFHTSDNDNMNLVIGVHIARYFVMALFVIYLYPLIFTKILSRGKKEA